ncbi:hypothetical protein N9Y17_02125 [Gammaproteobacteria bacterium]|nr:hypothetical protein [Gammaproteobacteria bacterium]
MIGMSNTNLAIGAALIVVNLLLPGNWLILLIEGLILWQYKDQLMSSKSTSLKALAVHFVYIFLHFCNQFLTILALPLFLMPLEGIFLVWCLVNLWGIQLNDQLNEQLKDYLTKCQFALSTLYAAQMLCISLYLLQVFVGPIAMLGTAASVVSFFSFLDYLMMTILLYQAKEKGEFTKNSEDQAAKSSELSTSELDFSKVCSVLIDTFKSFMPSTTAASKT